MLQALPASSMCMWSKRTAVFAGMKMLGFMTSLWTEAGSTELSDRSVSARHDLCPRIVRTRREKKRGQKTAPDQM